MNSPKKPSVKTARDKCRSLEKKRKDAIKQSDGQPGILEVFSDLDSLQDEIIYELTERNHEEEMKRTI